MYVYFTLFSANWHFEEKKCINGSVQIGSNTEGGTKCDGHSAAEIGWPQIKK